MATAPSWIATLPDEEGAILAFTLWKSSVEIDEGEFRDLWYRFIRLRAASAARTVKRALERELEEFSDVIGRAAQK